MRRPTLLVCAVLCAALVTGCGSKTRRDANRHVREGRFQDAAELWLAAVEADTADPVARKFLARVAPDAYAVRLDVAREREAAGDLPGAIVEYETLLAWLDRLGEVEARDFPTDNIAAELDATRDALARQRYEAAIAAFDAGRFTDAIAAFVAAREVRPNWADSTTRLSQAHRAQAEVDLDAKRYRAALGHWEASAALDQDRLALAWAAALQAAYGRHFLREGACRAAWDAFVAAKKQGIDVHLDEDLEKARQCAEVEVVLAPFEDLVGAAASGVALGALLSDLMGSELRTRASEHVELLDPDGRRSAGASRYELRGRVTQFRIERPAPVATPRTGVGLTLVECDAAESTVYDDVEGFLCEEEVPLAWTEHHARIVVHVGASLRVVGAGGEQVLNVPLEAAIERSVTWADGFSRTDDEELVLAPRASIDAVSLDEATRALSGAPQALPTESALVNEAVHALADRAAEAVLAALDRPPAPPEPTWLDVKAPVLEPAQIEFKSVTPRPGDAAVEGEEEPI